MIIVQRNNYRTNNIQIKHSIGQSDTISLKLFTNALEDVIKCHLNLRKKCRKKNIFKEFVIRSHFSLTPTVVLVSLKDLFELK